MMSNIEVFDEFVALIFAELYANFPEKRSLDILKLSGCTDINDYGAPIDPQGNTSKRFDLATGTVEWLVESGYIRVRERMQYGFSQAVLSAKGLELLKSVPESFTVRESIGDKLIKLVKHGSIDLARQTAKAAISAGLKLAL